MGVPVYNNNNQNDWFEKSIIVLFVLLMTVGIAQKCSAQKIQQKVVYDTVMCNQVCIQKYVQVPNEKTGKVRIFAVYKDEKNNLNELINVPQSVFDYIQTCKTYGIPAQLGIKLRNGAIVSIIRIKTIITVRR